MMAPAPSRMTFVEDAMRLLWPNRPDDDRSHVVLPSRRAPRLLVPVRPRRAAASATIRYTAQQPLADRMKSAALALAVWGGALSALPPVRCSPGDPDRESIDDYLAAALGTPVLTTLAITAPRANRKAVLQVFDRSGHTLAFAKVGIDDLTSGLVDHEADTLEKFGAIGLTALDVPEVLHRGSWNGKRVVVSGALARGARVHTDATALHDAMHEISTLETVEAPNALASLESGGRSGLAAGLDRFSRWLEVFDRVQHALPLDELSYGTWHGDWTEWNCSMRRGRVAVWDWERCERETPAGADRLHYLFNQAVGPKRDRFAAAAADLIENAPAALSRWNLSPAQARATAVVYLLKVCFRYLSDNAPQQSVGSRVEQWAYPIIERSLGRSSSSGGGPRAF